MQHQKPFPPITVSLVAAPLDVTFLVLSADLSQGSWRCKDIGSMRRSTS